MVGKLSSAHASMQCKGSSQSLTLHMRKTCWHDSTFMLCDLTVHAAHYAKYSFAPCRLSKRCQSVMHVTNPGVLVHAQAHRWMHAATYVLKRWVG